MNWLAARLTREGQGVSRNATPERGLALLADVVRREWWMLIQLNLLYVLFALPVVTLPAAHVAATRISALMLEDRSVYLLRDFWKSFRGRFWRATVLGGSSAAVIAAGANAALVFLQAARTNIIFALPLAIAVSTIAFATLATVYALTLLALEDQPLTTVLRRALLGALAQPLPPLAALAIVALLWLVHIALYPASIFMPAVLNFSFGTLITTLSVHHAATRLLAHDRGVREAGQNAGEEAPLRAQ